MEPSDRAVDLHEDLVRTPSHDSVDEVRGLLLDEVDGAEIVDSGCVVASKGDGEPHVVLNTHMDTVTPHVPFERDGDVVRGRGACDAKASLAAMAAAFEAVEPNCTVELVVSPDEETTSQGLHDYLRSFDGGHPGDFAVVGEPTELDVCTAARGRFELVVEFKGEAAHAASGGGVNAVSCAAEAVRKLEEMASMHDDLLGESSLTVTRCEGGGAGNQVPAEASLFVDRRSVPPETAEEFQRKVEEVLVDLDCDVDVGFSDRPTPFLEAFRTPEDDSFVQGLVDAADEEGCEPDVRSFGAATEASYLAGEMPVAVFGAGAIDDGEPVAHAEREYVRLEEVRRATRALVSFLVSL